MTESGLTIEGLTIAYGGNLAVTDVSLDAPMSRVTGLIGPNGAGKTSIFNACSGLLRPRHGTVGLLGHDITTASSAVRARLGLGRTFQRVEVCPSMTVGDNVRVGYEARLAGHNPWRQLIAPRRAGSATDVAVAAALKRCGLDALERSPVGVLSTGRRRLVELARVVAGGFRFLLLDEPSSGLDDAETEQFAVIVRSVVEDLGVGVLLVEHDMPLVMGLCDQIHVIDFGRHLFAGAPHEVASSAVVRAAYLGTDVGELS